MHRYNLFVFYEKKVGFAAQGLSSVPTSIFLAKKMGKGMGRGKILFRSLSSAEKGQGGSIGYYQ
jgi:hypothetical protein